MSGHSFVSGTAVGWRLPAAAALVLDFVFYDPGGITRSKSSAAKEDVTSYHQVQKGASGTMG